MFDVLVYLYENYGALEACPDAAALSRSLSEAGFEDDEIHEALVWLQDLAQVTLDSGAGMSGGDGGFRVFTARELSQLGPEGAGFLVQLERAGQLVPVQREAVLERAMACTESPVPLATLRVIVLMVLWSLSADVDLLLLEDLLGADEPRQMH